DRPVIDVKGEIGPLLRQALTDHDRVARAVGDAGDRDDLGVAVVEDPAEFAAPLGPGRWRANGRAPVAEVADPRLARQQVGAGIRLPGQAAVEGATRVVVAPTAEV